MTKYNLAFQQVFLLLLVFNSQVLFAQLPNFTLQVSVNNEACPGNGSLQFTVSGTAPGSSLLYNIYKLPNIVTPIATVATNSLSGLTAGAYIVVATQTLSGVTNTQQQEVTITITYVALQYEITSESCSNSSTITIEATQGTATLFEIYAGPVTFPAQASNTFSGLPDGYYQIRVFDNCGAGFVSPLQLISQSGGLTIAGGVPFSGPLSQCGMITVSNSMIATLGNSIIYPLSLQYTIYPPSGGTPILVNSNLNVGSAGAVTAVSLIPFYNGQQYSYDLLVTDACGNVFTQNNNVVNAAFTVLLADSPVECSSALMVIPTFYHAPYTVTFLDTPVGFDPELYSDIHPGPFLTTAQYYNPTNPVPTGSYTVSVTDDCGNIDVATFNFDPEIEVLPLSVNVLPGCEIGFGSFSAASSNGELTSVVITAAPSAYLQTLPYDVSFNIYDGGFFMNSLPAGNYQIHTVDSCGNIRDTSFTIVGYQYNFSGTLTENCGAFNLLLNYSSSLSFQPNFYLQKFNSNTNTWGHPVTGAGGGSNPDNENSIQLLNNIVNVNLPYQGSFRVLVAFPYNNNGSAFSLTCVQQLYTFEFNNSLAIDQIIAFSCDPTSYDVVVSASGVAPLTYRILTKNGAPFVVENGPSNLFANLAPAVYLFQVEDSCGNSVSQYYDTTEPFSYVITSTGFCDGANGSLSVPAFSFINYEWWRADDPNTIISTLPILEFSPFDDTIDLGTYFVRVFAPDSTPSCIDFTLSYEISDPATLPDAGQNINITYCENPGLVSLFELLDDSVDTSGTWFDLTNATPLSSPFWDASQFSSGTFIFEYTVNGWCATTDTATAQLTLSATPQTPSASNDSNNCEGSDLQLFADGPTAYQYQWVGPY